MLVIVRMPLRALRSASSAAALPRPNGETMPMPVMATRITTAAIRFSTIVDQVAERA